LQVLRGVVLAAFVSLIAAFFAVPPVRGCCPAPRSGQSAINADQSVIILWDAATKTEHFIRKASFKSDADDFGFLVPTPTRPELAESGNDAFPFLTGLTNPKRIPRAAGRDPCERSTLPLRLDGARNIDLPPILRPASSSAAR